MIEFNIKVDKVSGVGKNNYGVTRTGIHYPKKNFVEFRQKFISQIQSNLLGKPIRTICEPCFLEVRYSPNDKRKRDATAILDALFNILETIKIVSDDSLIKKIIYEELEISEKAKMNIVIKDFVEGD